MAKRIELARQVGEAKLAQRLPIKDFQIEKQVLEAGREQARSLGIPEDSVTQLLRTLIDDSCRAQEEIHDQARSRAAGNRKRVVVIGGAGGMGNWLARYFESFGHRVAIQDIRTPANPEFEVIGPLPEAVAHAEVLALATPIATTPGVLEAITALRPKGLVFDICSLKSPLLAALDRARQAGLRVTSVHPMFGPKVRWLAGRNLLVCDVGVREAAAEAESLFRESAVTVVPLPLERHDSLMAYVLGLSHLVNLVFGAALQNSGELHRELCRVASTTFNGQSQVTRGVLAEDPTLYFQIQAENISSAEMLDCLRGAVDSYARAIAERDEAAFRRLMETSRLYFDGT